MPFDWREYLDLAQSLMGRDDTPITSEAAFRCAMSRIYLECCIQFYFRNSWNKFNYI